MNHAHIIDQCQVDAFSYGFAKLLQDGYRAVDQWAEAQEILRMIKNSDVRNKPIPSASRRTYPKALRMHHPLRCGRGLSG
tara:strand:+ start:3330 stop:3569 length:240 start_codon:yes stop_codon:yes gene_type:complete